MNNRRRDRLSSDPAASRLIGLNSDVSHVKKKHSSATLAVDVTQFSHQINADEVFGIHKP
jgi:hypothetical protein